MRTIISFLCFFILFSCTKKNTLNTEKIDNNPVVVTFNEDLDKKIYNDDLETDYNDQKIIEKRHYTNPLYEFWTLGGRYTTHSFYYHNGFRKFRTFISNLDGFSDAMIVGNNFEADDSSIMFLSENNGYYSFHEFLVGIMTASINFSFEINDEGVIILTSDTSTMYNTVNNFKIEYKYQDDKLVLFNYSEYDYTKEYPKGKENKLEMTEFKFVYLNNKFILRNSIRTPSNYDIVFINEDTEYLRSLYIAVLRKSFFSFIDYISEYQGDSENLQYNIIGLSQLYSLTKKEIDIFEDCIYEYLKDENKINRINKEILFYILKELKKK